MKSKECWVVTDGRAGIENQAVGLAEAVARETGIIITKKTIALRKPWRSLPRAFWGDPFTKLSREKSLLRPPFPDLWIACGRVSTPFTVLVKALSPQTFTVQLQNPRARLDQFDLVIPPVHDGLEGDNVFAILGAPNRITTARLAADGAALAPVVDDLPRPRVAVLVGGSNGRVRIGPREAARLASRIGALADDGAGLLVTTSRRSPEILRRALSALEPRENALIWDGAGRDGLANPYPGMLAVADHVIVTEDSVNMAVEAGASGKPVHIHRWRGDAAPASSVKFRAFHDALEARGVSRPFLGNLDVWRYEPLRETERAAREVVARWLATNVAGNAVFASN